MKILYVDHPEPDFMATLTYLGLCQVLGPENVIDWPYKDSYHGETYRGPIPYDPPHDQGVCAPYEWMPAQPGTRWKDEEVFDRLGDFDLVVLASPRKYGMAALDRLLAVGRPKRLVMTDGEDYTTVRWDCIERFRPSVYFKLSSVPNAVEVYHGEKARMLGHVRVLPYPMCSALSDVAKREKTVDVAFIGGGSWRIHRTEGAPMGPPDRERLVERLRKEFTSLDTQARPYLQYIEALASARIAVCVGGHGIEPLRTLEILSCPETLLARERIPVVSPWPFVEEKHCVGWNGWDFEELIAKLRYYLEHEDQRLQIARSGNDLLKAHYTCRARAAYLLEEAFR